MCDNDTIQNFAKLYTSRVDSFKLKSGGHNNMYIITGGDNFAMRITPISHRNIEQIKSEIDYMSYLKSNGVSLTKPLKGKNGEYCYQCAANNEEYIVSAFETAVGEDYWVRTEYHERLIEIGKTLGKIHRLSKKYVPVKVQPRRQWNENQHLIKARELFKNYDIRLSDKFDAYMKHMAGLHKEKDSFGLIHGDYLLCNYFFNENEITVFDFDDCEYSWFISDLAVCMLYYLIGADPTRLNSRAKDAEEWFSLIMQGYLSENIIEISQIENIDLFFKMRQYNLLSYNLERQSKGFSEWQSALVDGILDRILNEKPFVDIDFVSIYKRIV